MKEIVHTPEERVINNYINDFKNGALKYFGTYLNMKLYYETRRKYFEQGLITFNSQCEHNVVFHDHTQDLAINNKLIAKTMTDFIKTVREKYISTITDYTLRIKALQILINEYEKD